jgi:hypothetical protein
MMNFSAFFELHELCEKSSVFIPEGFDWAKPLASLVSSVNLDIPVIKKQSRVHMIHFRRNPIVVHFADGSRIFLSNDEYRRMPKIDVGDMVDYSMFDRGNGQPMIVKSIRVIS